MFKSKLIYIIWNILGCITYNKRIKSSIEQNSDFFLLTELTEFVHSFYMFIKGLNT